MVTRIKNQFFNSAELIRDLVHAQKNTALKLIYFDSTFNINGNYSIIAKKKALKNIKKH